MRKKVLIPMLFLFLLIPMWIVFVFGYPMLVSDASYKKVSPGKTQRCFKIGVADSVLECYLMPTPKLKIDDLAIYLQEFSNLLGTATVALVVMAYFTVWVVNEKED